MRSGLLTPDLVSATVRAVGGGALPLLARGLQRGKPSPRGREAMAAVGANRSVHGGSIFPRGIGASPQRTIYAVAIRLAHALATRLTGRQVTLA